jgi:hypothetical protein
MKKLIYLVLGSQIFIHGGISEEDEYLSDSYIMSIGLLKWSKCKFDNSKGPSLAWHAACLVLPSEIANNPYSFIYKFSEEKIRKRNLNKVI